MGGHQQHLARRRRTGGHDLRRRPRPSTDRRCSRRPEGERHRVDPRPQRPHQRRSRPARRRRCPDPVAPGRPHAVGGRLSRRQPGPRDRSGDNYAAGGHTLAVIHTPGHSPGAVVSTIRTRDWCCRATPCSAAVRARQVAATATNPRSSARSAIGCSPFDDTIVHTGHGDTTVIGDERNG